MKDIGILLKETREGNGLKISDASSELKIRRQYLEMLEKGEINSAANEIYLTGYLRSYANWLGLDGKKLCARLTKKPASEDATSATKKEKTVKPSSGKRNIASSIASIGIKPVSAALHIPLPGKKLMLALLLLPVILFILLYENNSNTKLYKPEINISGKSSVLSPRLAYLKDDPRKLIIMANEELTITITKSDGTSEDKLMTAEEIFFLPKEEDILITADKPDMLDIFIDDQNNTFLGSLTQISK